MLLELRFLFKTITALGSLKWRDGTDCNMMIPRSGIMQSPRVEWSTFFLGQACQVTVLQENPIVLR